MQDTILVQASLDAESRTWYVHQSTLAGLHVEASTYEGLIVETRHAIENLLQDKADGVSFEVIAHTHERISFKAAA
jgi:predicted RNase H-like HicB family nuclease